MAGQHGREARRRSLLELRLHREQPAGQRLVATGETSDARVLRRWAERRRGRNRGVDLRSLPFVSVADLRRTAIGPRRDERDLERRQRRVVREFAVAACGLPHGHSPRQDFLFNGGCPRTRFFIGRQRDGRGSAARMAVRAARMDDGGDFAVPRDFGGEGVVGRDVHRREQGPRENGCRSPPKANHIHGGTGAGLVSRPSGSWRKSRARRPDRKARRASIQAVCERGATPRGGMPRPGITSRTTGTGH